MKDNLVQVISPIDDTPAYHAGLQTNDLIFRIDNTDVYDLSLKEAVDLMRGEKGSTVTITYIRGENSPVSVDIVRDIITIQTVKGHLLADGVAYVRISSFQQPTLDLLKQTIDKLTTENEAPLSGFILDLRNNPGGLLTSAINISDLFLDNQELIVYTKGRTAQSKVTFSANLGDYLDKIPMVVLINEGSASASEIVAGALQDHNRAIIAGKTSFGKGSVQTATQLDKGYGIKLTTSRYYTPLGRSIQAQGIVPDIILKKATLSEQETSPYTSRKEANLKGHLKNEQLQNEDDAVSTKEELTGQALIDAEKKAKTLQELNQDYYVYQALNILKVMTLEPS